MSRTNPAIHLVLVSLVLLGSGPCRQKEPPTPTPTSKLEVVVAQIAPIHTASHAQGAGSH